MQTHYDFIVCGAGSSGSVVAGRLSEDPDVSVLLIEAGGSDAVLAVEEPLKWPTNIKSERDWGFNAQPNVKLEGRVTECGMGKVLGGGSSINALAWVHGHMEDWDFFEAETKDPRWGYEAIRKLYTEIEDWHGPADPSFRGKSGPVYIEQAQEPNPLALAAIEGAASFGLPRLESYNGRAQQGGGGAALTELIIKDGKRRGIYSSYIRQKPNLTILTKATVQRIRFDGRRACGIEVLIGASSQYMQCSREIILSLGAINTPKLLMQSGIGEAAALQMHSIPVFADLPGVGNNFQDHACFDVLFEYDQQAPPRNNTAEALLFAKSRGELSAPDLLLAPIEVAKSSPELAERFPPPAQCWAMRAAILQPKSRGRVSITGARPDDPVKIETAFLDDQQDVATAIIGIELCQAIGRSAPLSRFRKNEFLPGEKLTREQFARLSCVTFHHQSCTAKMGLDEDSVVDSELRVYGIDSLRIADGSVLPKITRGNTMAPCVIVGERAARLLKAAHGLRD